MTDPSKQASETVSAEGRVKARRIELGLYDHASLNDAQVAALAESHAAAAVAAERERGDVLIQQIAKQRDEARAERDRESAITDARGDENNALRAALAEAAKEREILLNSMTKAAVDRLTRERDEANKQLREVERERSGLKDMLTIARRERDEARALLESVRDAVAKARAEIGDYDAHDADRTLYDAERSMDALLGAGREGAEGGGE